MTPIVTVLMAVRNGGGFLRPAIESVLAQTLRELRLLIVDDASTDGSAGVARACGDPRVSLIRLERNIGQTAALNVGLGQITTPWMARMDADDYSAPGRLEAQLRAVEGDPALACVGTAAWEFRDDPAVVERIIRRPERHEDIQRALLQGAAMIHGTLLVRRAALEGVGGYDETLRFAADRELFVRLLSRARAANLPTPLVGIRQAPGRDSFSRDAADEYIEIFSRMLASPRYDGADRQALRDSLAYAHLFRAWCLHRERRPLRAGADALRAAWISPRQAVRSAARFLQSGPTAAAGGREPQAGMEMAHG